VSRRTSSGAAQRPHSLDLGIAPGEQGPQVAEGTIRESSRTTCRGSSANIRTAVWEEHGISVLQRLAVTDPGKLAQIAYGLLPRRRGRIGRVSCPACARAMRHESSHQGEAPSARGSY